MRQQTLSAAYSQQDETGPLVSVLIPVYNRQHLIQETIESALNQEYSNVEVVVVDNFSTDETWEILRKMARSDGRIRIFQNKSNIGPVANWLACVKHARGAFGKILWSDDLIHTDFISRCVHYLADPEVGFVFTAVQSFTDNRSQLPDRNLYASLPEGRHPSWIYINNVVLWNDMPLSPGCALFRMEDLRSNLKMEVPNSISSDFSQHAIGNDLLLYLLTAAQYKYFATVSQPLSFFRHHAGSISVSSGEGRLATFYNITRAYFLTLSPKDERLEAQFNSRLWLHLKRFDCSKYGVRQIQDFYPSRTRVRVRYSTLYFIRAVLKEGRRMLSIRLQQGRLILRKAFPWMSS